MRGAGGSVAAALAPAGASGDSIAGWGAPSGDSDASVAASSGVLGDKKATAFPGLLESLGKTPAVETVVMDGKVITSRGPGTAMDFALKLIEVLVSKEKRDEVEKGLAR